MGDIMSTRLLKQSVQIVDQEHSIISTHTQDTPLNSHDRWVLGNTKGIVGHSFVDKAQLIRREKHEDDDYTKTSSAHKKTSTTIRLNFDEDDEETEPAESVVFKTKTTKNIVSKTKTTKSIVSKTKTTKSVASKAKATKSVVSKTKPTESVVSKTEVKESKTTYKKEQNAPITSRALYDAVPTNIASHVVTASFFQGYGAAGGHAEDASVGLGLIGIYEQTETSEANLLLDQNRQYFIHLMGLLILLNFFLNRG